MASAYPIGAAGHETERDCLSLLDGYSIVITTRLLPCPTHLTHVRQDVGIIKGPPGTPAPGWRRLT
jgi:hypothetical protein